MTAPRATPRLIARYIASGRGFGHGENYLEFLQLQRWNASPVSVQTLGHVPPFRRRASFMCRSEWLLALLFSWCGGHVRAQLPLWPWRHPHPLSGLHPERDGSIPWSSGTLELCRRAGVAHGTFVGTSISYIWTIDLAITLAWLPPEKLRCAFVSVKPLESEEYTGDIDPIARGPEKLEVERRYTAELVMPYFVADRTKYPGDILGQLEWLSYAAVLPTNHPVDFAAKEFLQRHGPELARLPPTEWASRLQADFGLDVTDSYACVHHILWNQIVDADLSVHLRMDRPPKPGGRQIIESIRTSLLRIAR